MKGNVSDIIEATEIEYDTEKILQRLKDTNCLGAGEMSKLVTIATFDQSTAAHIDRVKLESEGIECFISDENIMTMLPLYSTAVGAIKLQVRESDVKKATDIISQRPKLCCPKCNSLEVIIRFSSFSWLIWHVLLVLTFGILFALFPAFLQWKWKCSACGHKWK